jgi:lysophospholipase L1-like esterase
MRRVALLMLFFVGYLNFGGNVADAQEADWTVVAFGDSTTAPRGELRVYTQVLKELFDRQGVTCQVINAGVGGNSTSQARARFEHDVLEQKPECVILQFGINDAAVDVWRDPPARQPRVLLEDYEKNLRYFCRELKSRKCQIVLMTPNPLQWTDQLLSLYGKSPYQPEDPDGFNVLLKRYSDKVREIARDEKVILVDVDKKFRTLAQDTDQELSSLLLDGMHPNAQGHELIATALLPELLACCTGTQLIESITKETLWTNREGQATTWFHPRACVIPGKGDVPHVLMTLQAIGGSDYFGPVHWSLSKDLGRTWSDPVVIPALGRKPVPGRDDGLMAAVCDVTPQYHPQTKTVLALGHVVFYKGEYFARNEQLARYPIYAVRAADGSWSDRKILKWEDPRGSFIYSNNCGQRVVLPDGEIQMSFTFGPQAERRMVAGVRARFDGETLEVNQVGPPLQHPHGRGLLEPSVAQFQNQFWMTIRAEDGRGYVTRSADGIQWEEKKPWSWDDGTPLDMSTTQQHWLTHSDGLFLVYTRKDKDNINVIRWRSPLYVAQVDVKRMCLIRSTERTVLPLVGDGVDVPDQVALMGNFNVTHVSPEESWVTVGEWMPKSGYRGDVLLARIRWSKPNRLPLW